MSRAPSLEHCIVGIEPRRDNIKAGLERSLMLVTALAPKNWLRRAARSPDSAQEIGTTLQGRSTQTGLVTLRRSSTPSCGRTDMIHPKITLNEFNDAGDTRRERTGEFVQRLFEIPDRNPEDFGARCDRSRRKKVALTPYEQGNTNPAAGSDSTDTAVRDCGLVKAGWIQNAKRYVEHHRRPVSRHTRSSRRPATSTERLRASTVVWKLGQDDKNTEPPETVIEDAVGQKTSVTFEEAEDQAREEIRQYLRQTEPLRVSRASRRLVDSDGLSRFVDSATGQGWWGRHHCASDALGTKAPRIKVR